MGHVSRAFIILCFFQDDKSFYKNQHNHYNERVKYAESEVGHVSHLAF